MQAKQLLEEFTELKIKEEGDVKSAASELGDFLINFKGCDLVIVQRICEMAVEYLK